MDISVIIPIYRVEKYIERCLRSLFTQTKTDGVEFILINDASPDASMSIVSQVISEFPHLNIQIIDNEKNLGIGTTRQIGLNSVTGDYTIQIDSDDWCEPTMLEEMYAKALEENADVVNADYYENKGDSEYYIQNSLSNDHINNVEAILSGEVHSSLCTRLTKRALILDNKIEIKNNFNIQEDLVITTQILYYAERVVNIDKAYFHYIQTPVSLTRGQINHQLRVKDSEKMLNELISFLSDKKSSKRIIDNLNLRKIQLKYAVFRHLKGKEQRMKLDIFPEVNKFILGTSSMKISHRIMLFLATHGARPLSNLVLKLVLEIKKI